MDTGGSLQMAILWTGKTTICPKAFSWPRIGLGLSEAPLSGARLSSSSGQNTGEVSGRFLLHLSIFGDCESPPPFISLQEMWMSPFWF